VLGCLIPLAAVPVTAVQRQPPPPPPGQLVDIGGQRLHVNCTGRGSTTVLLENGTGDFSVIWALVQPGVAAFTRVCSYDRGGYAWSEPGARPRTFAQLGLELRTALRDLRVGPPYVLVGQSYGGLVVRGFARQYRAEVVGMVLVDAVHEDQQVVYGGQPHRIRESARGRSFPAPHIALDRDLVAQARAREFPVRTNQPLDPPLDRLPETVQRIWHWAQAEPLASLEQDAETDWSPEELARMHDERVGHRATLGDLPLLVLARTAGGYPDGMKVSAADLERERRDLQLDLAGLSTRGQLVYAPHSGHNIHIEDPDLVVRAIRDVVTARFLPVRVILPMAAKPVVAAPDLSRGGASWPDQRHKTAVLAGNGALVLASHSQYTGPAAGPRRREIMGAKRSMQAAWWIGPDDASASSPTVPAGAVLASELVFHQLAFEALALSIVHAARTARESAEEDRTHAR
jgi:pimeloyl-ACP methyl ester carboxylesterase